MAFESGWIESEEDQKYVATKGFKDITGRPFPDPLSWAIDRERDIILISRGGGGLEMPEGYALYLNGEIIDMEGYSKDEGSHFDNTLKIHWYINKIEVTQEFILKGYTEDKVRKLIEEALISYSYYAYKPEQIIEVTVEINAEFQKKEN